MDDNYIKSVLGQTFASYKILQELRDKPEDLVTIRKELGKIQGLLQALVNKMEKSGNSSDSFLEFVRISKAYLGEYSFYNELDKISALYSEDPNRIKNLRLTIIFALEKSGLISKLEDMLHEL